MSDSNWNISVKTVSSYSSELHAESNFQITVNPNDSISSIYQKIESHTGLKADQQRLIYRGRLITALSHLDSIQPNDHISDISGLGDGHTIHLVPRPSNSNTTETNASSESTSSAPDMPSFTEGGGSSGFFSSSGPGFLAALLGMNPSDEGIHIETINTDGSSVRRSSSNSTRRRNRNSHIRTENDPLHPEPCQMEVIRQSLLTMHTMMDGQEHLRSKNTSHPLQAKRRWYKGQWIDVKDTVNQWLEATVVDIMTPDEIIRSDRTRQSLVAKSSSHVISYEDEAVGSNDEDGRLKLLLEPSEDPNDRTLADLNDNEDLIGFRERDGNEHVQLLLIHFNGWPHRWDEWIRSDSDRIRPFRTRSRHVKKTNQFCPELESEFQNDNSTNIRSVDDDVERPALLPEIFRTMTDVQTLYAEAIHEDQCSRKEAILTKLNKSQLYDLSIAMKCEFLNSEDCKMEYKRMAIQEIVTKAGMTFDIPKYVDLESLDDSSQVSLYNLLLTPSKSESELKEREYPWVGIERMTDMDEFEGDEHEAHKEQSNVYKKMLDKKKLQDLAPLLDRLGRILIDAAPHVASIAASLPDPQNGTNIDEDTKVSSQVESNDREETAVSPTEAYENESLEPNANTQMTDLHGREDATILPDHVDFVNGFINHRENGSNFRRRIQSGDRGSSLLSAYLSNMLGSGGNATQGGRPGNVDVHIHAIVTGPEGIPMNPMSGLFSNTNRPADPDNVTQINIPHTIHPTAENDDLFSDLYATNANPTDDVEIEDDYHGSDDEERRDHSRMDSLEIAGFEVRGSGGSSHESEVDGGDSSDEDMPSLIERRVENGSDDESENDYSPNHLNTVNEQLVAEEDTRSDANTSQVPTDGNQSIQHQCDDSVHRLESSATEINPSSAIDVGIQSSESLQDETPSNTRMDNEDDRSPTGGWLHRMLRRM